jgi:hypothetical protein
MAEPDRLVAALRYQQELNAAQRPATMNPNIAAQGERSRNRIAAALASQPPSWSGEALPMEGRAAFLPFQDTLPGSVMNTRSLALPGIVAGAVNAITAPGRALDGSDQTFDPQEEAANFALNVMGGGIGTSRLAPAPAGSLGMFIGKTAKTWNAAAEAKALEMEKIGATPQAIWRDTGNWKAPDGAWRQEIPDNAAASGQFSQTTQGQLSKGGNATVGYSEALSHPQLSAAYPHVDDGLVVMNPRTSGGAFLEEGNVIQAPAMRGFDEINPWKIDKSTMLHELQHSIQQKEGFAPGGNQNMFDYGPMFSKEARNVTSDFGHVLTGGSGAKPWEIELGFRNAGPDQLAELSQISGRYGFKTIKDALKFISAEDAKRTPYGQYLRLAGEAEARATQARIPMDAAQRRVLFPADSYDVPLDQLIIRR